MKRLKNIMQLAGMASICYAVWTSWHDLPIREALLQSFGTLTTVEGPGADVQILTLARTMPERLFSSPWLLVGITLVLVPYLIAMIDRALPQHTHQPAPRRY